MVYGFKAYPARNGLDTFWVAESMQLEGCMCKGDTIDDALKNLAKAETNWVANAAKRGRSIPLVEIEKVGI